ncbi:hypothetical protein XACM_4137 [Xanthomonas euvesicatoria pv. citrumelo F1]|nr:hypothetical protein XACM_4137 [Xanthomonas euvesicatoria pv. citrumelo F1]
MAAFVKTNLTKRENPNDRQKITQPTTKQSTTPAPSSPQR